jgi:uncharacterized protein YbgA (DUF1722 family)
MVSFTGDFLDELQKVDGFLLKSRSPSCGMKDVKQYRGNGRDLITGRGTGLFGGEVLRRFSGLAVEDDGRLHNSDIRDHFLKKLFTLADFRRIREEGRASDLVDFQARNKLLLMSYNQKEMRLLGRIVAAQKERGLQETLHQYGLHLAEAMKKGASFKSNINVMQHAFGYVSGELKPSERAFFLDNLEMYREGRTTLANCLNILRSWVVRFDVDYLAGQTFFNPYPEILYERCGGDGTGNFW